MISAISMSSVPKRSRDVDTRDIHELKAAIIKNFNATRLHEAIVP